MSETGRNTSSAKTKSQLATEEQWRCKYVLPREPSDSTSPKTSYACPHQIDEQFHDTQFCIFHYPKPSEEEKKQLNERQLGKANGIQSKFNQGLASIMTDVQSGADRVLDFRGFIFPHLNWTHGFEAAADFSHAIFTHDVDFSLEDVVEYETFGDLLFSDGVKFRHARFLGLATFSNVSFRSDADFGQTTFEKAAAFDHTLFAKDNSFDDARFKNTVNFYGSRFQELGGFSKSTYAQEADFTQSVFESGATFFQAIFHGEAFFDNVLFGKEMDWSPDSTVPTEEVAQDVYTLFHSARFKDTVSFEDAFFDQYVSFNNATFEKEGLFISEERTTVFGGTCEFKRVKLHKDSELVFFRVDLSRASFHDTNLELVNFRDVTWAGAQTSLGKLLRGQDYILWDEIRPLEGIRDWLDDARTAENYRQLVINYERKRDYESAEYFHIGEMEMRRKSRATAYGTSFQPLWWVNLRQYINGHGLYWLSSKYGTSYAQALGVLLVMVLGFSFLFLYTGFQRVREGADNPIYAIEYNVLPDQSHHSVSMSQWASDFGESISFTLSILTFQRDRFYQPLNALSRFVLYLSVFLLTAQAALTLLAIRRRFKR